MTKPVPNSALVIDPATRPEPPVLQDLTEVQQIPGRHLRYIHYGHLKTVNEIRGLMEDIRAGRAEPGALKNELDQALFAQNLRGFGAVCGRECQLLNFHHNAEEYGIFNDLEANGPPGLVAVVKRLRAEHEIVHELLIRLDAAADLLRREQTAANFDAAAELFELLEAAITSHFTYEENSIGDAIGVYSNAL